MQTISVSRFEDMSPRGRLEIKRQPDGDIIVTCWEDPSDHSTFSKSHASVEFCTSGGQSPKVLRALYALMSAIEEENAEDPQKRT